MIYSMSGFGRAQTPEGSDIEFLLEIKSVNSRYCDINVKMSNRLVFLEDYIRNFVKEKLSRGKIDVYVSYKDTSDSFIKLSPDFALMDKYNDVFLSILDRYGLEDTRDLDSYLGIGGIALEKRIEDEGKYFNLLEPILNEALDSVKNMRANEGEKLRLDLLAKLDDIEQICDLIEANSSEIVEKYAIKLRDRIEEMVEKAGVSPDLGYIAHEVAVFADKTDVDEEIVRFNAHIDHFRAILNGEKIMGRKLDFLAQEMLREVNTIGSKTRDLVVSGQVIEMKSIIERIKEQVMNIL